MTIEFMLNENEVFKFRELNNSDNLKLGNFFTGLSDSTRSKFGPHPLTKEHALILCNSVNKDSVKRFVVENSEEILGYFIIDFNLYENERLRYMTYGIEIDHELDPVFAPCIADKYQNKGIAGKSMKYILDYAKNQNLRSLILMGGTQEPNKLAINFYKKFGFKEYGRFYTANNNLNNIDMMLELNYIN